MAIEVIQTPRGPRGRDTVSKKFTKIPSSLGAETLPNKIVPKVEAYTEGMELSGGAAALGGDMAVAGFHAMVFALQAISNKIDTLIGVTQEALGIDKKENIANELESERDAQDRRDERLEKRDRDKDKKGKKGPGILGGIWDIFKNFGGFVKDKAMGLGDFVKMFLFAGGLYLLSKYSDQLVKYLSPILKYFKEDFLPDMEEFGTWVVEKLAPFVKQSWLFIKNTLAPAIKNAALWFTEMTTQTESYEDEFGRMHQRTAPGVMSLDWDKIKKALMIGIGAYLTLKFLPFILFSIGGKLLAIPGLGLAVGIVGLGAYLIWSAIKMAGQAMLDSADWTKEKGATDDKGSNAVGAFFGGEIKGSFMNAVKNAGKWGKYFGIAGFMIGLFGGPLGALAGGVLGVAIGVIFGGILGLIGGGWIAKIYQWIQDSILNIVDRTKNAILGQEEIAAKRDIILKMEKAGATRSEAFEAAGFDISHPRFFGQHAEVFGGAGFGTTGSVESLQTQTEAMNKALDPKAFLIPPINLSKFEDADAIDTRLFNIQRQLKETIGVIESGGPEKSGKTGTMHDWILRRMSLEKEQELLNKKLQGLHLDQMRKSIPVISTSGQTLSSAKAVSDNAANTAQNLVVMHKQGDNVTANTANQYIGSYDVNNNDSINGLNITLLLPFNTRSVN